MHAMTYRPEIDGLRAVAVLAVVLYHAVPGALPGGFVGVDVFFVISGYLITSLLAAEHAASGRIDLPAFYARRARRLLPALALVLAFVLLAALVLLAPRGVVVQPIAESAWASLLFLANLHFLEQTGDYFAAVDQQPLLHLWSLAVEEQFYLLFPLLLLATLRRGRAAFVVAALALLSLAWAELWTQTRPSAAFYAMPTRFWELAAGALVALSPRVGAGRWQAPLGLGTIVVAAVATPFGGTFPGLAALPAVAGAALLIRSIHVGAGAPAFLSSRPMVGIGLLSYGWYLWHWPLLTIDRSLRFEDAPVAWRLALCAIALGLAAISLRYVERPVRRWRLAPLRVFGRAAIVSAVIAAGAFALTRASLLPADTDALIARTRADFPDHFGRCHFEQRGRFAGLRGPECNTRPDVPPRIALWGDSHAASWQPLLAAIADARGTSGAPMTMGSCSPVDGYDGRNRHVDGLAARCAAFNAAVLDRIVSFDAVVIAARWPADDSMEPLLASALDRLAAVPEVMILGPIPELRDAATKCIASGRPETCAVSRPQFEATVAPVRAMLARVASTHPNVTVLEPAALFCDERRCRLMRDGRALYFDQNHPSVSAAEAFAQTLLVGQAAR